MKVSTDEVNLFKPFNINFTIESEQDAAELYTIFNRTDILSSMSNRDEGVRVRDLIKQHLGPSFGESVVVDCQWNKLRRAIEG